MIRHECILSTSWGRVHLTPGECEFLGLLDRLTGALSPRYQGILSSLRRKDLIGGKRDGVHVPTKKGEECRRKILGKYPAGG